MKRLRDAGVDPLEFQLAFIDHILQGHGPDCDEHREMFDKIRAAA